MSLPDPGLRLRVVNDQPADASGRHVLYWMRSARRVGFNFGLERAVAWARELTQPLLMLEQLRLDTPWASDRQFRFVIDGMAENRRRLAGRPVTYHAHVEQKPGEGQALLKALAEQAGVVVTDDSPTLPHRRLLTATAQQLPRRLEAVDSNGLLPMAAAESEQQTAHAFRRLLQRRLPAHLDQLPLADPLAGDLPTPKPLPAAVAERWPAPAPALLRGEAQALASLAIDHSVPPAPITGGSAAAEQALHTFLEQRLERYAADRNRPDQDGGSLLSPYLATGHLASHQVFLELMSRQRWSIEDLSPRGDGRRSGWWGTTESAEAFLDQLITWRELGLNLCRLRDDYESYAAVPAWARRSLDEHAADERPYRYSRQQLEAAATHDQLWNAAQRQLLREGRIHGYLRMLWGKKVLEWSEHPAQALATLFALNDRHALDGNDANSATGMLWILGRYDRPWGPRRPIFGTVRYMCSANTARKLPVKQYLHRYGDDAEDQRSRR